MTEPIDGRKGVTGGDEAWRKDPLVRGNKLEKSAYNERVLASLPDYSPDLFRLASGEEKVANEIQPVSLTFLEDAWRRLKQNKAALVSLGVLVTLLALALFAPILSPHSPIQQNPSFAYLPPKIPGLTHWSWFDGLKHSPGTSPVDAYQLAGVPKGTFF